MVAVCWRTLPAEHEDPSERDESGPRGHADRLQSAFPGPPGGGHQDFTVGGRAQQDLKSQVPASVTGRHDCTSKMPVEPYLRAGIQFKALSRGFVEYRMKRGGAGL